MPPLIEFLQSIDEKRFIHIIVNEVIEYMRNDSISDTEGLDFKLAKKVIKESSDLFYHGLSKSIREFDKGDYEKCTEMIAFSASVAWIAHPGFFMNSELERLSGNVGKQIVTSTEDSICESKKEERTFDNLNILHVLSTVANYGGHTRLVAQWIANCRTAGLKQKHSIVLTRQSKRLVPDWLRSAAKESGGEFLEFPSSLTYIERAKQLREYSKGKFDIVVLHIHPDDPIAILAFSTREKTFPILFMNHADHAFSIGTSIADEILDIRKSGQEITRTRRGCPDATTILPIPIEDNFEILGIRNTQDRDYKRKQAKEKLGIPLNCKVMITIGNEWKYRKALGYDFARLARRILMESKESMIYAIGVPGKGEWKAISKEFGDRFVPMGMITDKNLLAEFHLAADLYLEGFPVTSLTALLDAGIHALPIQRMVIPSRPVISADDVSIDDTIQYATTEDEYLMGVIRFLSMTDQERNEIGFRIRERIKRDHCGESWVKDWLKPAIQTALVIERDRSNREFTEQATKKDCLLALVNAGQRETYILLDSLRACAILDRSLRLGLLARSFLKLQPLHSLQSAKNFSKQIVKAVLNER